MATAKKASKTTEVRALSPTKAAALIEHCMAVGEPVILKGSPGIGKSDIIREIGRRQGRAVIDMRLTMMSPEDLKGIPYYNPVEGTMRWAPASEFPQKVTKEMVEAQKVIITNYAETLAIINETWDLARSSADVDISALAELSAQKENITLKLDSAKGRLERYEGSLILQTAILFLDELNGAQPSVQGAAYQLILDRKLGEYELPEGVSIVAAGNLISDKGAARQLQKPLANRFVHLHIDIDFEDWQKWAVMNKINADVVGFLSHHTHKLFNFDPKSPDEAFATPRTWAKVSNLLNNSLSESETTTLVAGTVGDGMAIEFMAHRRVASKMPKAIDVLEGKVHKLDVEDISARYSLTINMCYILKELSDKIDDSSEKEITAEYFHERFDNFLGFLMNVMQPEMVILGAQTAMKTYGIDFKHDMLKNFDKFYEEYGTFVLDR